MKEKRRKRDEKKNASMYAEKQYFTTTLTSLFFNFSYECNNFRSQLCKQFFVKLI